ncbi:hypothetical protein HPG69_014162 [Diceros bicornis minor]|uniref:DRBM domain-containing protein n=1 Tax=Diceros bicornis minor TaxID=77932 RepID=A0A7J7FK26_DICBM|nr:hypothetical protein HPG69_014162 [Diceros bicornis minor]
MKVQVASSSSSLEGPWETEGTSSADVKENRNVSNLEGGPLPPGDRARGGAPGAKRKRPLEEGNGSHLCKLQLIWKKLSWSVTPKNALVQLHELRPGLQYRTVSQTGPVHAPVFAVAVEVNGLTFEGTGPTKKKAKMRAAELALRSFVQFPNACQAHLAMGGGASPCTDFTSDQADFPDTLFKEFEPAAPSQGLPGRRPADPELLSAACRRGRLLCRTLDLVGPGRPDKARAVPAGPGQRNPVVVLNELRAGLHYVCLAEPAEARRAKRFVMAVCVDGRTFEGSGRSKKLAKGQAAQAALQALFDIRLPGHVPSRSRSHLLPQVRTSCPRCRANNRQSVVRSSRFSRGREGDHQTRSPSGGTAVSPALSAPDSFIYFQIFIEQSKEQVEGFRP